MIEERECPVMDEFFKNLREGVKYANRAIVTDIRFQPLLEDRHYIRPLELGRKDTAND